MHPQLQSTFVDYNQLWATAMGDCNGRSLDSACTWNWSNADFMRTTNSLALRQNNFPAWLSHQLSSRRPSGTLARRLGPELAYGRHHAPARFDARAAAVAVVCVEVNGRWQVVLTERSRSLRHHAGQISLPGGSVEQGESPREAALRELNEELAVPPDAVEFAGQLPSIWVYASNFQVYPFVFTAGAALDLRPNPDEVASCLLLDLDRFADRVEQAAILRPGMNFRTPAIKIEGRTLWGATLIVLGLFAELLED